MTARRLIARASAVSLIALLLGVVDTASPPAATARCAGSSEVTSSIVPEGGWPIIYERAKSGTCNDNLLYQGYLKSNWDGWRAHVCWNDWGGPPGWYCFSPGDYDTGWYSWGRQFHDWAVYESLCLSNRQGAYVCGWGKWSVLDTRIRPDYNYGTNFGY